MEGYFRGSNESNRAEERIEARSAAVKRDEVGLSRELVHDLSDALLEVPQAKTNRFFVVETVNLPGQNEMSWKENR